MTADPQPALTDFADDAVARLDDDQQPGPLPELEPGWNDVFVRAIRTHKEQFRGSKDLRNLLRIAGELLYGKDIHWAMELVQNAEDAGATRMAFVFEDDRVLVWNNGASFAARDVWAICSAGHSAKRNKIGFFGIGFKSVYKVTAAPEIYSGPYSLRIEDKLYPTALDARRHSGSGAWFVLPLMADQRPKLRSMISALVSHDFAQVLLTLTHLGEIRVFDRTGAGLSGRFRRTVLRGSADEGWDECDVGGSWEWATRRTWRRFFFETSPVPAGIEREGRTVEPGDRSVIILARPADEEAPDLRLHCYLPTAVRSELRWLLQADFEPSASREQLRHSPWNEWLMREAGAALVHAVRASARDLRLSPWDLVPLPKEVRDPLQQIASDAALAELRTTAFVATRRGWRRPSAATWGYYPGVTSVVREGDLRAATGEDVSYVSDHVLGQIAADTSSRAEEVLEELGANSVGCEELVRLFGASDAEFDRVRRDGQWWIAALGLVARHASDDEKRSLAATKCLPVRGAARVRPSPSVDADGYLVAFSRSDLTEDLREYLGESQVLLIDAFLSPRPDARRSGPRTATDAKVIADIAEMLEADPFNVAPEAGPLHVVASLIIPRLNALAARSALEEVEVDRAWRMVEYIRQKWPTYVSEYRRRRNDRASDASIGMELGRRLSVVARVGQGRRRAIRLIPVSEAYLPTELVGFEAMDLAMADDDQVAVIDPIHGRHLRVAIRRRGGRARSTAPPALEFLKLLGAPLGPKVVSRSLVQVTPGDIPWVDWSGLPGGARGRVGLERDWDAPDVARFATRWPSLSPRARARRGAALLRSIEADWLRLKPTVSASAQYFYSTWNGYGAAASTWIGRLRQLGWLPSLANTLERPTLLVVDTHANRLALGGALEGVLRWTASEPEALGALGVGARPAVDRVVETLASLRTQADALSPSDALAIARACYQTLSDHLRDPETSLDASETKRLVAMRMRGGAGRGLIYAPPPEGVKGEQWWPPSRVIQSDAMKWVGPYLGQLAGRYRTAGGLWDALEIRRDLSREVACEVIARDLVSDADSRRAREYYGRLVAFIEDSRPINPAVSPPPALTTSGWQPPEATWWSARSEVREALGLSVPWWQPGDRDPSSLRRAAAFLGVREAGLAARGGPLSERWDVGELEPLELEAESRWQLAIRTWPEVLRQDSDPARWGELDDLAAAVALLRPAVATDLRLRIAFTANGERTVGIIEPPVALRARESVVLGASEAELFSTRAAESVATLLHADQRAAGLALALLLTLAAHDPNELEMRAAKYAVVRYQHREFPFVPEDFGDVTPKAAGRLKVRSARTSGETTKGADEPFVPLADPIRFGLVATSAGSASGKAAVPLTPGKLKPPAVEETGTGDEDSTDGSRPPAPKQRYANTDIESAARPFIEEYELETRNCTVVRQGPGVGADYVASDGRYIELKAFSGDAPDSFELEAPEWRAAQHPDVGERYWVYVVEHLRDGRAPKITAILNPVVDTATSKEPAGKLRVRGWKNARNQHVGVFGERQPMTERDPG